jgi:hypothetical protein
VLPHIFLLVLEKMSRRLNYCQRVFHWSKSEFPGEFRWEGEKDKSRNEMFVQRGCLTLLGFSFKYVPSVSVVDTARGTTVTNRSLKLPHAEEVVCSSLLVVGLDTLTY